MQTVKQLMHDFYYRIIEFCLQKHLYPILSVVDTAEPVVE